MTVIGFVAEVKSEWLAGFTGRSLAVGLFDGEDELIDATYERQPIEFGDPNNTEAGLQFIENVNEAVFPSMGSDHDIDHWGVFDEQGQLLGGGRLEEARVIPEKDRVFFEPGDFTLGLP